jgi:hypothetical protein
LRGNSCQILYYLRNWQLVNRNSVPFPQIRVTNLKHERRNKQTNISFQNQDSKTACTQNPSTKVYEITEANLMAYLTCQLKFNLPTAKRRFSPFVKRINLWRDCDIKSHSNYSTSFPRFKLLQRNTSENSKNRYF